MTIFFAYNKGKNIKDHLLLAAKENQELCVCVQNNIENAIPDKKR